MRAREFHRTSAGEKVLACIGNSPHIAKIIDKDPKHRKFLLRFHLANGDKREEWRNALRCENAPSDSPMGHCQ